MAPSTNSERNASTISDETTPLLATIEPEPLSESTDSADQDSIVRETGSNNNDQESEDDAKPLPKTQIFLLCYTSLLEPIAFFSIFPYVNFMIENVGDVKKEDVGFYAGLIESLFSATQMCVMIFWGRASDRWGRKPILIISLVGVGIATTMFGLSQSLWQMVLARCFGGIFGGTVVTIRAMLSENSTKQTQAKAFSYFAFARNLGIFLGPLLGGVFETPTKKYPSVFGNSQFFQHYPYALPGMVTSALALSAALFNLIFLRETLHDHRKDKATRDAPPMSSWQLLKCAGVMPVLLVYNYVMLIAFTFTAVNPVFMYTPIELGGFGFSSELIAVFIALAGAAQAAWLLLVFPRLHKRVGTGQVLWFCACAWPVFFALNPAYNLLLRYGATTFFWVTAAPMLMMGSGVAMAFVAVQLALNDIAPSHETLGTLNSLALALTAGIRATAPAAATSIYAIGVKYHILKGHLFWLINILLAIGLLFVLRVLPEKAKGKVEPRQNGVA